MCPSFILCTSYFTYFFLYSNIGEPALKELDIEELAVKLITPRDLTLVQLALWELALWELVIQELPLCLTDSLVGGYTSQMPPLNMIIFLFLTHGARSRRSNLDTTTFFGKIKS